MLKGAYIFVIPDADSSKNHTKVDTPSLNISIVGVKDFNEGAVVAKNLVEEGAQFIDLCSGFGPEGAARVIQAVGDKVPVAAAYFGFQSVAKAAAVFS